MLAGAVSMCPQAKVGRTDSVPEVGLKRDAQTRAPWQWHPHISSQELADLLQQAFPCLCGKHTDIQ